MVVTVGNDRGARVPLNNRIDVRIKAAYEREIVERHGLIRPYAGIELERELSALVGNGRLSELFDAVHRLSDALGETPREKKTQTPPRSESTMCRYRVRESVRNDVMALAQQRDVTYPRELVERVMWDYAQGRSAVDKAVDRMGRIRDKAESELGATDSTTERRKLEIVNELKDRPSWTLREFDEAVDQKASGISSGRYARERYLDDVLNELEYTWHPKAEGVFIPKTSDLIEPNRDPRSKPYVLMNREDKQDAVRVAAIEKASQTSIGSAKYSVAEGVRTLDGRPNNATVEQIMESLAKSNNRFIWKGEDAVLLVKTSTENSKNGSSHVAGEMEQLSNAVPARQEH